MLRLSAQKVWSEGRANPVWYQCSSWLGTWATEDRITWRTTDGKWVAQLERSPNGRHTSLAFYNQAGYVGRQDASGFHVPTRPRHAKRPVERYARFRSRWRVIRCRPRDAQTAIA